MLSPRDEKENPSKLYPQATKCTVNTVHIMDMHWVNVQIFTPKAIQQLEAYQTPN